MDKNLGQFQCNAGEEALFTIITTIIKILEENGKNLIRMV